jgi:hypothetical protein
VYNKVVNLNMDKYCAIGNDVITPFAEVYHDAQVMRVLVCAEYSAAMCGVSDSAERTGVPCEYCINAHNQFFCTTGFACSRACYVVTPKNFVLLFRMAMAHDTVTLQRLGLVLRPGNSEPKEG